MRRQAGCQIAWSRASVVGKSALGRLRSIRARIVEEADQSEGLGHLTPDGVLDIREVQHQCVLVETTSQSHDIHSCAMARGQAWHGRNLALVAQSLNSGADRDGWS